MLYNKQTLEEELARLECLDQQLSALVAQGLGGFRALEVGAKIERARRAAKMKLVRTVQIVENFRLIKKMKQTNYDTLYVRHGDGREFFGEEAMKMLERSARFAASHNRVPDIGSDEEELVAEEENPVVWVSVRRNPLGFLEVLEAGKWLGVSKEYVNGLENVYWR